MIPLENYGAFLVAAAILVAIPGPSVLFTVGRSIALGRRAGVLSVVGNALGMLPAVLLVAFGVGAIVASSVVVFTVLKVVGGLYLVWLGVQAIRHRRQPASEDAVPRISAARLFAQGVIVGATNPKTIAFFVAVLPQFVDPAAGQVWVQLLLLGLTFMLLAVAGDTVWALAAGTARDWFARSPRRIEVLSATGGAMMVGLGGTLMVAGSKS